MKYCTHCGKELLDAAVICLSCGCRTKKEPDRVIPQAQQVRITETEPQLATWAKICGIVSFFIGWFALGITAIILAYMSKGETNGKMCFSAKVGCICGVVSTVLSLVSLVLIIAIAVWLTI